MSLREESFVGAISNCGIELRGDLARALLVLFVAASGGCHSHATTSADAGVVDSAVDDGSVDGSDVDGALADADAGVDAAASDAAASDAAVVNDPNDPSTWVEPDRPVLPDAPPWAPPGLPFGAPGWQTSTVPFCNSDTGAVAHHQLHVDTAGVYVWTDVENPHELDPVNSWDWRPSGSALHFNDGSGWRQLLWGPVSTPLLFGSGERLFFAMLGGITQWTNTDSLTPLLSVNDLFFDGFRASAMSGYALGAKGIYRWNGIDWNTPVQPYPTEGASWGPLEIGGDATHVLLGGVYQYVALGDATSLADLHLSVPAGDYTAVWFNAIDDYWLGNSAGDFLHFNGLDWQMIHPAPTSCGTTPRVTKLWSDGSTLYFIAQQRFGRLVGNTIETLAEVDCNSVASFDDLDGLAGSGDVFFTMTDMSFVDYACGTAFVVRFDGTEFHRF